MHIDGKYLLVKYRDLPDTEFICENGGDLRIRVSRVCRSQLKSLPEGFLLGVVDKSILVFENVSTMLDQENDEIVRAVQWYRRQFGVKMNLLYVER
jgi:hypothetical protein